MDIGIEKIKNWGSLEYLISVEEVRLLIIREITGFIQKSSKASRLPKTLKRA